MAITHSKSPTRTARSALAAPAHAARRAAHGDLRGVTRRSRRPSLPSVSLPHRSNQHQGRRRASIAVAAAGGTVALVVLTRRAVRHSSPGEEAISPPRPTLAPDPHAPPGDAAAGAGSAAA